MHKGAFQQHQIMSQQQQIPSLCVNKYCTYIPKSEAIYLFRSFLSKEFIAHVAHMDQCAAISHKCIRHNVFMCFIFFLGGEICTTRENNRIHNKSITFILLLEWISRQIVNATSIRMSDSNLANTWLWLQSFCTLIYEKYFLGRPCH